MGQTTVDEFLRLYVAPGANHGGAAVSGTTGVAIPQYADLLGALDQWVERGEAPGDLIQTSVETTPPFAVKASRPLCRFPKYPRYRGSGDPNLASSFVCETH
jgi:feruloyl esterase